MEQGNVTDIYTANKGEILKKGKLTEYGENQHEEKKEDDHIQDRGQRHQNLPCGSDKKK